MKWGGGRRVKMEKADGRNEKKRENEIQRSEMKERRKGREG